MLTKVVCCVVAVTPKLMYQRHTFQVSKIWQRKASLGRILSWSIALAVICTTEKSPRYIFIRGYYNDFTVIVYDYVFSVNLY